MKLPIIWYMTCWAHASRSPIRHWRKPEPIGGKKSRPFATLANSNNWRYTATIFFCAPSLTFARAAMHKQTDLLGEIPSWWRKFTQSSGPHPPTLTYWAPIPGTCIWNILHQNTPALFHHASMIVATNQRRRIKYLQNGALGFVCISTFKVQLALIYNVSSKSISLTLIWTMTM